jgi:hypothetical protein
MSCLMIRCSQSLIHVELLDVDGTVLIGMLEAYGCNILVRGRAKNPHFHRLGIRVLL